MAMCAMTQENILASPAWVPKSYQCSARIPSGPVAEAWHALQGEGDEFSDLEEEDVCDLVVQWNGQVGVHNLLDDVSGDWDWRIVPCCC